MKFKKIFIAFISLFTLTSLGSFKESERKIETNRHELITNVKRMASILEDEASEEETKMFSLAFESVKSELTKYIDIVGLNVTDKETITLENYNKNYIVPKDYEVVSTSYYDMIETFDEKSLATFEDHRKINFEFDSFVTKAETRFKNLDIEPKYVHKGLLRAYNPNSVQYRMNELLLSIGLSATAIAVLIGCADTLLATAPIAWFTPVSVPVSTVALLGIATVILLNWDLICQIITELINLFVECINQLAYLVKDFFDWVLSQVQVSSVSGTMTIGNQSFTFTEIQSDDVRSTLAFVNQCRRKKDILLMMDINGDNFKIALGAPVTMDFCIAHKTHTKGFSSYTWYQDDARNLILKAGTGYTSAKPDLNLYNENENKGNSRFAFKHFHNYTSLGKRDKSSKTIYKTHSFFGLLYYTPNNDGVGEIHPSSPKN